MQGTPFGRYGLVELLGRGGMGEVWRAHDTVTDRVVAIKVLPAHLSQDEDFQRRFRREAHAAARLDTPHVVPIYDYGEIDGRLFVSMRLIKGRDLDTVLADGPLEPTRAVRIIDQVAKALHAAHEIGLIHRDIKPSNILLDRDDFAYLIDFGIARAASETRMTKAGSTIGTFAYMAPERLDPHTEEDARADIYSLACVLYEALTGEPPFAGTTTAHLMYAHVNTRPPRPSSTQPGVPAPLDAVIAKGMAKGPDQRYATTIELADAARGAITVPVQQPAPTPPQPPTQPATARAPKPAPLPATKQARNRVTAQPSTVIAGMRLGRYRVVELLGRGGLGEVWRAHDIETDRIVALQLLSPRLSEEFQRRFRREVHAAARLREPHVIPIHDHGEIDGRLFVSMRLIEGRDLDAVLADGPLDPARAVRIVEQVASALDAAHRIGLMHHDLKPSKILITEDDFAYLVDLGIVSALQASLTDPGTLVGTFAYMAPERFSGDTADSRADIYSLACVLYQSLTGEPPYPGDSVEQQIVGHVTLDPPPPSQHRPDVPVGFDDVIARGMAKDPDRRYQSAHELANAARDAVGGP